MSNNNIAVVDNGYLSHLMTLGRNSGSMQALRDFVENHQIYLTDQVIGELGFENPATDAYYEAGRMTPQQAYLYEQFKADKFHRIDTPITQSAADQGQLSRNAGELSVLEAANQLRADNPGRRALNKRLRKLFDAKYIDRPRAQLHTLAYGEKRPMVYALGNAGADILANRFQMRLPDIYWTEKNRRVKEKFIEHTLGIADFMIGLEVRCRATKRRDAVSNARGAQRVRLIGRDEILAASSEGKRGTRMRVFVFIIKRRFENRLQIKINQKIY